MRRRARGRTAPSPADRQNGYLARHAADRAQGLLDSPAMTQGSSRRPRRIRQHRGEGRRPAPVAYTTPTSVVLALLWVLLGVGSLASAITALWVVLSLSRASSGPDTWAVWHWLLAIIVALGLPFALATWKHQGDTRKMSLAMAWLPMVWNTSALIVAVQLVPDLMGSALRGHGAWVAANQLGDSHSATRVMSALGHDAADAIDPQAPPSTPERRAPPLLDVGTDIDMSRAISIPLPEKSTAILVNATLEGANGVQVTLPYLFDTGASFTTISSKVAQQLGVQIPENAPILEFDTASGPRESRMAYLPALTIGRVRSEGLLVSVCDGCINQRHQGLLGHNVMRGFLAQLDFKNGRLLLVPRNSTKRPNRAYDLEQVVEIGVHGDASVWDGRVHWQLTVKNPSAVPIYAVVPTIKFTNGPTLTGQVIEMIPPGGSGRSLVDGAIGNSEGLYKPGLAQAYW